VAGRALTGAAFAALLLLSFPLSLQAQGVEIAPFTGYRIGGDPFDAMPLSATEVDRAPSVGCVLDFPLWDGLQIEGLFSHQQVDFTGASAADGLPVRWHGATDHWQGGAIQEYGAGAVRPFLSGVLGFTRYAIEGDTEIRFTVGGGGGVKLFPTRHAGVRLDGRVFSTFLDAFATGGVCGSRGCALALHLNVAWQLEFTAALVVKVGQSQ
jgi:hypothetical protein